MSFIHSPLSNHIRVVGTHKAALARLGIETVRDLLYHFPVTYNELSGATSVTSLTPDSAVTLYGTIHRLEAKKSWTTKKTMATAVLKDHSGQIKLQWFSQPYIAKMHDDPKLAESCGKLYDWVGTQRASDLTVEDERLIQGCKTAGLYHSAQ